MSEEVGRPDALVVVKAAAREWDALVTGVLASEKKDFLVMPGRLLQAWRNGDFIRQLEAELKLLIEKGDLKPDQLQSEPAKASLQELMSALETPPVDQAKFDALKAAFLKAVRSDPKDNAARLGQTIIRTVASLNSAELELPAVIYRLARSRKYKRQDFQDAAATWESIVMQHGGFECRELVQNLEEPLVRLRLLSPRTYGDQSGIVGGDQCRLTSFGVRVCEFLGQGAAGEGG